MYRRPLLALAATTTLVLAAGCASSSTGGSSSSGPIVLGATLSLSGNLGSFGGLQQKGYQQAVALVNASGGLKVDGKKRKVTLKILDNRSDANTASSQARELILKDNAVALLGPCTPPPTIPVAQVADSQRVPMVTSCSPTGAFSAGNKGGWKYAWDLFFSEKDQAATTMQALGSLSSNKKVALFTDTEPDGVVERSLYKAAAQSAGLQVVGDYTFPPGTSDFSGFINDAKAKGAQLVIAQVIPPDGIALWKQMKALALKPVGALAAKAAVSGAWGPALGDVAEGTLTEGFWSPDSGNKATNAKIESTLGKSIKNNPDLSIAVISFTAAQVLLDGIQSADSTDATKVNTAIGKTDKSYALGAIKFTDHVSVTPHLIVQWQSGNTVQVLPPVGSAKVQAPPAGLN